MLKKLLSMLLAVAMLASLAICQTAYAAENDSTEKGEGEYYTYYFLAPANWFTTNDSIGLYYYNPKENAKWPGEEVTDENCVYKFDDGRRVFKVQVWQNNDDTKEGILTTPIILFNSFVDVALDPENGHQTSDLNLEGYYNDELEFIKYGSDETTFPRYDSSFETLNFNNMIYVPNPEEMDENEYSGAVQIKGGVWYYYYGDGRYGTTQNDPSKATLGDVDASGKITLEDVVYVQKAIAKLVTLSDTQKTCADVTKDGKITLEDVVLIQKYIAKLVTAF